MPKVQPERPQRPSEWLADQLSAGPVPEEDLIDRATARRYSWRAVLRAGAALGIRIERIDGRHCWMLDLSGRATPRTARPPRPVRRESTQRLIDQAEEQEAEAWARARGLPVR